MDGESVLVLATMAAFLAVFFALIRFAVVRDRRARAAVDAMVTRNGWQTEQRGPFAMVLRDPAQDWELELHRPRSTKNNRNPGSSRFRVPEPRIPGGLCYVAVDTGGPTAAMLGGALNLLGTGIGQAVARRMLGDEHAALAPNLRDFPAPEGTHVMVLSTDDPAPHVNLRAARALHDWNPARGVKIPPFILIDDRGMELRLQTGLSDADQIEAFVALAQHLRQELCAR